MFIGRTDVEAETPILWPPDGKSWLIWKDPDAGKDWGQEEKGTTEDEMVRWHHRLNGHGFGSTPGVGDRQGGLVCCSSWGCKESDTTEWLNWTEFSRPREMLWVSLQNYSVWSLLRITYEDSARGVSWTCGQADLHGQKTFGAELWKLSAGSFLWAGPSVREGDSRGWWWHLVGRKEGAVGNIFILNYLLIIQEKFSACLPHAQVFSSWDARPEGMDSPWVRTETPQPPPQVLMLLPQASTLSHRGHSWSSHQRGWSGTSQYYLKCRYLLPQGAPEFSDLEMVSKGAPHSAAPHSAHSAYLLHRNTRRNPLKSLMQSTPSRTSPSPGSWAPLRGKHDTPEGTEGGVPPSLNFMWALPLCGLWVAPLMTVCLLDFVLPSLIHNLQSGSTLPVDKDDRDTEQQQHLGD